MFELLMLIAFVSAPIIYIDRCAQAKKQPAMAVRIKS